MTDEQPRKVIHEGRQTVFNPPAPQPIPQAMPVAIEALAGVIHAQALLILELSEKFCARAQEEAEKPRRTL